jgi:GH43 family beta-xylosidase
MVSVSCHHSCVLKIRSALLAYGLFPICLAAAAPGSGFTQVPQRTFTNPLLSSGPDPWVIFHDGFYYYMNSTGRNLMIRKTRSIADLGKAKKKVVWKPPRNGPYSHELWAPELHFLNNRWYLYFAADAGQNSGHRIWVLENDSPDPLHGRWKMRGKLADPSDKWAIDASVFENKGQLYAVWSGWPGNQNGEQDIYIARMSNPWTIEGNRVRLSAPQLPWETIGDNPGDGNAHVNINEGPEILEHGDSLFLIYSASGCWTDSYTLGMLIASRDSDLLDPASWRKSDHPVFAPSPAAHAYGTGHNSFFKSPDGKEDWIIYHANPEPHQGCRNFRSPRAQPFTWNPDGTPDFGTPVPLDKPIPRPSGEAAALNQ